LTGKTARERPLIFRDLLVVWMLSSIVGLASCGEAGKFASSSVASSGNGFSAAKTYLLSASVSSLSFGSVAVGASTAQLVSFTNVGNSNVTISSASASGTGFSASGGSITTLAPNDSVSVSVNFAPAGAGSLAGSLTVLSDAANSPMQVALSGTGAAPLPHSVTLNWLPSPSAVLGYFVYRGAISGGPYFKLNPLVDASAVFVDPAALSGQSYFYVVTSVDPANVESAFSNEVAVTIP
jgi:hypothetical protein